MPKETQFIRSVKGTRDLLPSETYLWQRVEDEARAVLGAYNFREIRTPILEQTALFARSVGEETDIVTKEMYTLEYQEVPELGARRSAILLRRPGPSPDDLPPQVFRDDLKEFVDKLQAALTHGEIPKTPGNERALRQLDDLLTRYRAQEAQASQPQLSQGHALRRAVELLKLDGIVDDVRTVLQTDVTLGESLTLRPEATASVVRAYIEHSLYNEGGIQKLYYIGPMFRRERPQKGRYRQFYQIGAEVLGSDHPTIDAEVIEMLMLFLSRLELKNTALLLNSVGCPICRPEYLRVLRQALDGVKANLCTDCQRRAGTNPLRVLDCKVEADQPIIANLPSILDHLGPECRQHFDCVTAELGERGIEYTITPRLVRGLDYYTKTTFEITSGALGAQNALLGGGRYDGLAEMIGGPPTPGIGFSIGEDRLVLAAGEAAQGKAEWSAAPVAAYIVWMGDRTLAPARRLARELRRQGLSVEIGYEPTKLKKSMGIASRIGARFAVIIGEGELESGRYQVKDMASGEQQEVESAGLSDYLRSRFTAPNLATATTLKSSD